MKLFSLDIRLAKFLMFKKTRGINITSKNKMIMMGLSFSKEMTGIKFFRKDSFTYRDQKVRSLYLGPLFITVVSK